MNRPHASNDVRARALAAIDDGKSVAEVASFFRCDPSTVRRWIRRRTATGSSAAGTRCGRPHLIGLEQESVLRQPVAARPDATLAEHRRTWEAATGTAVSLSTMSAALRRLAITFNKRP
jgi:transposase